MLYSHDRFQLLKVSLERKLTKLQKKNTRCIVQRIEQTRMVEWVAALLFALKHQPRASKMRVTQRRSTDRILNTAIRCTFKVETK